MTGMPFDYIVKEAGRFRDLFLACPDPRSPAALMDFAGSWYAPDARLPKWIDELESYDCGTSSSMAARERIGRVLEGIAFASFACIKGVSLLSCYRAPDAQYDLLVVGEGHNWKAFCNFCRIDSTKLGVLVEAKAHRKRVSCEQFSRVCSNIAHTSLIGQIGLGVIFSLRGATGFPTRASHEREISLREARLRQFAFYLTTQIPTIVFDLHDIKQLY
jgi:hypothetical protein